MRDIKKYRAALLRWLGFAADFAASASSGSPIGFTTDVPTSGTATTPAAKAAEESDGHGLDPQDPDPTEGTGAHGPTVG
jgi:hypothetical protein